MRRNMYAEQARVLSEAGVDLLVIETQFDLNEAKAAIRGAQLGNRSAAGVFI